MSSNPPPSPSALIDMQVIENLKEIGGDDDPGLYIELIGIFLQDAPHRMEEMRRGLDSNDLKVLERAAHTLKSSCANVGALPLAEICRRMEESARFGRAHEIRPLYDESRELWPRVEAALRAVKP
jgi:HPt (histidine-containing phosphotransfer) domain-containing protein